MIHLNTYEELLQDADDEQVRVHESVDLNGDSTGEKRLDGLYIDGHIALDSQLKTTAEKTSILAEEMGHHFTSVGDITNLKNVNSRQQELDARLWGYNRLIGLRGIIRAFEHHCQNRYEMAEQLYQIYGGLLFVGLFIGILFLMATALIIYYKQISEGYQDKKRFEIMQNVGMSLTEVKKTIRSQVLMVFFLPLVAAGIHIAVSFRIVQMMVRMLAMGETKLFGMCTLITLGIFCVIYGLVYAFTAKSYYNIVRVKA